MEESEIIQITENLLCNYYQTQSITDIKPPINPIAIAQEYDIKIYSSQLDDHVDGIYDKSKKEIYVSRASSRSRQAFTIAHELGHYFLHADKDFDVFYRRDLETLGMPKFTEEKEANYFAANLLMPAQLITKYHKQRSEEGKLNIAGRLAETFKVSETAVKWRLRNLGLPNK